MVLWSLRDLRGWEEKINKETASGQKETITDRRILLFQAGDLKQKDEENDRNLHYKPEAFTVDKSYPHIYCNILGEVQFLLG